MCQNHYALVLRNGSPVPTKFFPSLDMSCADVLHARSVPHGDCLLWTGSISHDGYGSVNGDVWGTTRPHRFSWMLVNGPVPDDFEVDHLCHNDDLNCVPSECLHRRCVNPDHLELVDHDENMRRQFERQAKAQAVALLREAWGLLPDADDG